MAEFQATEKQTNKQMDSTMAM